GRGSARPDRRRVRAMTQRRIRVVYMRGGTSRCLVFHEKDLPAAGPERDRVLLAALGSPDPYGRQLDGLGGGISSLSKACIIRPPRHPDAQVDYTFALVAPAPAGCSPPGARSTPSTAWRRRSSTPPTPWSSSAPRISAWRAPSRHRPWTPTRSSRRAWRESARAPPR